MDSPLQKIADIINQYIGGLINVADMPESDKTELKQHLLAAEEILLRNGNVKLSEAVAVWP